MLRFEPFFLRIAIRTLIIEICVVCPLRGGVTCIACRNVHLYNIDCIVACWQLTNLLVSQSTIFLYYSVLFPELICYLWGVGSQPKNQPSAYRVYLPNLPIGSSYCMVKKYSLAALPEPGSDMK